MFNLLIIVKNKTLFKCDGISTTKSLTADSGLRPSPKVSA
jgi:hypothetical protein